MKLPLTTKSLFILSLICFLSPSFGQQDSCGSQFEACFPFELWRMDEDGCAGYRLTVLDDLFEQRACMTNRDTAFFWQHLGEPNYKVYHRSSFSYSYWVECGWKIAEQDKAATADKFGKLYLRTLQIHFRQSNKKSYLITAGIP